jgi:hypothetical protein
MKQTKYLALIWILAIIISAGAISTHAQGNSSAAVTAATGPALTLPNKQGSLKMLVFGDAGRGNKEQYELGKVMLDYYRVFQYDTALMTGDNIYGADTAADMKLKFEDVYKPLLDQGVKFYASLGNHDAPTQRNYVHFNMNGKEYYRLERGNVAMYALNSNYFDKPQLDWMITELANDTNRWKIAFFHHPPYSSGGRHGSDKDIRGIVHPLFVKHGVDVVFTGHDHFYERVKPQDGIHYFVAGAGGKIRKGDLKERSPITAKGFDSDLSFMLVEIVGDEMHFQVISRTGATVDSGVINRNPN